jgi:heat-inducible transcriptional repressor
MSQTHRSRRILFALVAEYIATGEPVGSRTVARKYVVDLSPATIRNVLSDLEESGLLMQPHTSAGRIPTDKALRIFIEALTDFQRVPNLQLKEMKDRFSEIISSDGRLPNAAMRETGRLIADMTGAAALVARSRTDTRQLAQLRFIVIGPSRLLAVLVFRDGMVDNRYIDVPEILDENELLRVHNLLADVVEGRSLSGLRELFVRRIDDERVRVDRLRRQAFELGNKVLQQMAPGSTELVIEGRSTLMDRPDYENVDRIKQVVRALEERENLLQLIDKTISAGTVSVYIGSEAGEEGGLAAAQLSMILAPYGDGEKNVGTVGVVGPTRMDYARIMPFVDATAAAMTAALKKAPSEG